MSVIEIILSVVVVIEFLLIWHVIFMKVDIIKLVEFMNFKDMTDNIPNSRVVTGNQKQLKNELKSFIAN